MRPAIVIFLSLLLVPGVWAAEQPSNVATVHVRKATAAYNLGKYVEAAKEYEAAYEQTLDPNLLFNIGQAYRLAGEREKAITAYRSFIRSAPESEQRHLAENKIRELERHHSTIPPAHAPSPLVEPEPAHAAVVPVAAPKLQELAPVAAPSSEAPSPASVPASSSSATPTPSALLSAPAVPEPVPSTPFYKGWPFWTAVGAVVVGAVVLTVVLTRPSNNMNINSKFGTQEF